MITGMDKRKVWRLWWTLGCFCLLLIPGLFMGWVWWVGLDLAPELLTLLTLGQLGLVVLGILALRRVYRGAVDTLVRSRVIEMGQFNTLFERSPVPYLKLARSGVIKLANPAAVKFFQATAKTLPGKNFFTTLKLDDETSLGILVERIKAGDTINDREVLVETADGGVLRQALLSVYTEQSEEALVVSLLDITEQKKVDTAKSEFVALATHQLRTPIAALRFNYELLERTLRDSKSPDQERYLARIERNILRMIALINDFLSVSKLELGTFSTTNEAIDLEAFCQSIAEEYAGKVAEKNLTLTLDLKPEELVLTTDQRLLHVIVSNLVSNAVKYVNQDGIVSLSYQVVGERVVIRVKDNGIGVPTGEIERLFTKFYRATNAVSHRAEGTGLGLYIVKQAVEQLGGTISVTSDVDAGAEFVVDLPLR